MSAGRDGRYTAVAVVLHWAIAAAIVGNLLLGWWMHEALEAGAMQARIVGAFQLHKSIGLTVLALTLLRLAWRLAHRPPGLPATMPAWERIAARAVHWAFYALMLLVPLTGWAYVSAQWRGDAPLRVPTLWFGLFNVPHLFDAAALAADERKAVAARSFAAHAWLAWSMGGLLVLHVAAALKHRYVDRDAVLAGMAPRSGAAIVLLVGIAMAAALVLVPLRSGGAAGVRSAPGGWLVDPSSEIVFAGTHAGTPFRGRFTRWEADIRLDPATGAPAVSATVETASATDGVPLHDETLAQAEWFDVATYPHARYIATRATPRPDGGYAIEGNLRIKDREIAVPPLHLIVEGGALRITGRFEIDRADADLGMESDPSGEYVSRRIEVGIEVKALRPE